MQLQHQPACWPPSQSLLPLPYGHPAVCARHPNLPPTVRVSLAWPGVFDVIYYMPRPVRESLRELNSCCPARPSISTVAPMGMEETIDCPSLAVGGATGAAGAYRADLPARAGAGADARLRFALFILPRLLLFSIVWPALPLNGAGVFAADRRSRIFLFRRVPLEQQR